MRAAAFAGSRGALDPPAPVIELYPDPSVDDAAGYSVRFSGSKLVFDNGVTGGTTNTQGDLNTNVLAALADSTPYLVTLTIANWVQGSPRARLKQGTLSDGFGVNGNGQFSATLTSGTSPTLGASFLDNTIAEGQFDITGISITVP